MKLLPDSIKTRTILVLLLGLTVSHVGSTLVYSSDRDQALAAANEQLIADKLATLAQVIDTSAEPLRVQVASAISGPTLQISWSPESEIGHVHGEDKNFALIQRSLAPHFGELGHDRLRVTASAAPYPAAARLLGSAHLLHGFPSNQQLQVAVALGDASWVNFNIRIPGPVDEWSLNALLSTLVMVVATLILAVWATGWITAPLAAFAGAAERLGTDVMAPPLTEDGPKEVRTASRAFNLMQQRIRSFVEDRLQMLAAISHDLRTPITRLRLRTEQLPIDAEQQAKMLADLDEMERMVSSSLAFAKDEATSEPSQAIDLSALLEAICDDAADAGRDAEFDWAGRLIYRGRPLAIKRLFTNLMENALRYGGRAKVSARREADTIEVLVDDQGPGIPEDQLEAVFKPFYRLETSRNKRTGGMGLGLANARSIARAHGGDVTLRNKPGGGLCAIVRLPCRSEEG
jgi:signal transduction histidine kinase